MSFLIRTSEPLLTAEEEIDLAYRIAAGDRDARDRMILANIPLVVRLAKSYQGRGIDLEDLISTGYLGLIRAVDEFDPARGTRLSTIAVLWIRKRIQCVIRYGQLVVVPRPYPLVHVPQEPSNTCGFRLIEQEPDYRSPPRAPWDAQESYQELMRLLNVLNDRLRLVITLRYGLGDSPPLTRRQIGQRIGLSRERVRQLEVLALRYLRSSANARETVA